MDKRPLAPDLKVVETQVFRGPNYWSYDPAIRLLVDLGALEDWPSNTIPGFVDGLLEMLPGIAEHSCSLGRRGGFGERLKEGTWLGHVAEHIALELQRESGAHVYRGKTRSAGEAGRYNVIYGYWEERVGLAAGELAVRLVNQLVRPTKDFDFLAELERLILLAERRAFGPSTQAIIDEAASRDIPWIRLNEASLVQLGWGKYQQRIRATMTSKTERARRRHRRRQARHATAARLGRSAGPARRDRAERGRGRRRGLQDRVPRRHQAARRQPRAWRGTRPPHREGRSRRASGGRCPRPAAGRSSSRASSPATTTACSSSAVAWSRWPNASRPTSSATAPTRSPTWSRSRTRTRVAGSGTRRCSRGSRSTTAAIELLTKQGYGLDDVPPAEAFVKLAATGNMSTGGNSIDRTWEAHEENVEIAEEAARVVGLDVAGIDFLAPDITQPVRETGGAIVEVNAAPGFRMHTNPTEGEPQFVAKDVVDLLFPAGTPSRIPIVAVTGSNGKTTTTRMIAHIFKGMGRSVGMTTTDGIYIDERLVKRADASGPKSAQMVLQNPRVDFAVFETARGGILREGLGYGKNDVGVVLNVTGDHLGLKGIDSLEQLAAVKQVVVEAVPKTGWAVLNADDELVLGCARPAAAR